MNASPSHDVAARVAIVELPLLSGASVFASRSRAAEARSYLEAFAPIANRLPREPHVMRLVDLDCGPGWFAAFAGVRFPYAWCDLFHGVGFPEDAPIAAMNAPVGSRFHDTLPDTVPPCDLLHVGPLARFGEHMKFHGPSLEGLQLAIVEWLDSERLETFTGLMRALGLEAEACGMFEPARGWTMYVRRGPVRVPINVDMTRKASRCERHDMNVPCARCAEGVGDP